MFPGLAGWGGGGVGGGGRGAEHVSHLVFFWFLRKAVRHDCGILGYPPLYFCTRSPPLHLAERPSDQGLHSLPPTQQFCTHSQVEFKREHRCHLQVGFFFVHVGRIYTVKY